MDPLHLHMLFLNRKLCPIHGQDVGMMSQPVQQGIGKTTKATEALTFLLGVYGQAAFIAKPFKMILRSGD